MDLNNVLTINAKEETMNFASAIECVSQGDKIHKLEWRNKEFYGILKDGKLKLHKLDGKFHDWIISDGDISGEDWIVV